MLIVEDGTGLANAESLASVASYKAYCDARGISYADRTDTQIEQDLRMSTDHMGEAYRSRLTGYRVNATQGTDFPRYEMPMRDGPGGRCVTAYYPSNSIPVEAVRACIMLAVKAKAGPLTPDLTQAVKSEKVASIEVVYQDYSHATKSYRAVDNLLAPLLLGGGSVRVIRG